MFKKLMLGTAVSALMLSGALAQAPSSPPPSASSPPPAAQPMSPPAGSAKSAPSSTTASAPAGDKAAVVSSQQPDQWLASKFKGTDVVGSDDKKIGDVSDILFDKSGKIEAYVISVGGFLGMGSKSVALAPSSFEVVPGTNGGSPKLKTSMNKDELKQAQNFTPYQPPRTTTGMGGSSSGGLGGHPASSPMPTPHK
jgi:sporulation protein YlmC with PRC-barrel domain